MKVLWVLKTYKTLGTLFNKKTLRINILLVSRYVKIRDPKA